MFGQRSGGRPIVATIAVAMLGLFGAGSGADAATKTVRTPEGDTCATADSASQPSLPAVLEACNVVVTQAEGSNLGRFQRYRGRALERTGQPAAAVSAYSAALQILPNDEWSLKWRAPLRAALGDRDGAITDYRQLNAMQPNISDWRRQIIKLGGTVEPPPNRDVANSSPPPAEPPREEAKNEPQQSPPDTSKDTPAAQANDSFDSWIQGYPSPSVATDAKPPVDPQAEQERLAKEAELAALVRRAQTELTRLGYEIGAIDGIMGSRTRNAMNDWLGKNGRPAVREPDELVVAALELAPTPAVAQAPEQPRLADAATKSVDPAPPPDPAPPAQQPTIVETKPAPPRVIGGMTPGTGPQDQKVAARDAQAEIPAQAPPKPVALPPSDGQKRVALVIGNSSYRNVRQLKNPRQDAEDMAAALEAIGFKVLPGFDLDRNAMDDLTTEFAREAADADVAVTYYAGHALQYSGANLLVPVDGQIQDQYSLRGMVRLDQLIQDTGGARKLAVVIMDACRDDPLAGKQTASRSLAIPKGLAQPGYIPPRTVVAYATSPGMVAYDDEGGKGRNSPYAAALLRHIQTPGVKVTDMFAAVTGDVARDTRDAQRPGIFSSLDAEAVYLVPGGSEGEGVELTQLTRGEVRAIELSLSWLGFWSGDADGVMTPGLLEALRRSGSQTSGDAVSSAEIVALHRRAAPARGRIALPSVGNVEDLQAQALEGDTQARRLLGQVYDPAYEYGGLQKSRTLARANYKLAATAGDAEAAARLGLILASPASQPAEQQEAQQWLEMAAKAGNPEAALRLGELLLGQDGDATARTKAVGLLQTAAADPDTEGFANALLRDLGYKVVTASSQ